MRVEVLGRPTPGENNDVGLIAVGPGFFESIGLGLLQGRYLNSQDLAQNPPVAIVNESSARHYFGGDSASGQRIRLRLGSARGIVDVVRGAKHYGVPERISRMVYLPGGEDRGFFVRSNLNQQLYGLIRAEVVASDKILPVEDVRTFE